MGYRAPISEDVHERVQLYMVGKTGNHNEVYEDGAKMIIDSEGNSRDLHELMFKEPGEEYEWFSRAKEYAENNDEDIGQVLNKIIVDVLEEDGSAKIKFKGKMKL
jgi:hypothetical protein